MRRNALLVMLISALSLAAGAAAETYWVPVAAHTDGVAQSAWRTDVSIINTCAIPVPAEVRFTAGNGSFTKSFIVAGGAQTVLHDVVIAAGATGGIGTVHIRTDGAVAIESRTYNAAAAGMPTQTYPTLGEGDGFSAGATVLLPLLNENSAARTNLGFLNMGSESAEVAVHLRDSAGLEMGVYRLPLEAGQVVLDPRPYLNRVPAATGVTSGYATVDIISGSGVYPFASVVSAVNGYPVTVLPQLAAACPAAESKLLDPTFIPQFVEAIPVPPAMPPVSDSPALTEYAISAREFNQQVLPAGFPQTTVWGYGRTGDPLPGPGVTSTYNYPAFTVEATVGKPVRVTWTNGLVDSNGNFIPHRLPIDPTLMWANPPGPPDVIGDLAHLPYDGPVPIVTHLHGAHVPDVSDGGPQSWYLPAARNIPAGYFTKGTHYGSVVDAPVGSAVYEYPNDQAATTLWFHDHALGITRLNVYMGLAGFWLIRDAAEAALDLPGPAPAIGDATGKRYYELPVVIQDRKFNTDGSLFYPPDRAYFDEYTGPFVPETPVHPVWNPEFFGDTIVVNGRAWPYIDVEPRLYRFRILNGANARFLILKFDRDGLVFHQIGSDGGLLPGAPVSRSEMLLAPAQRADVIVDFSSLQPGDRITLLNLGPDEPYQATDDFEPANPATTGRVMQFHVVNRTDEGNPGAIPASLPAIAPLSTALPPRDLTLNEMVYEAADIPSEALMGTASAGPLEFDAEITETPHLGDTEIWRVLNLTADSHPVHLHLVMFRVLDRTPFDAEAYDEAQKSWIACGRCRPEPKADDFVTGPARAPEPWEAGRMDTVVANPGEITRIVAKFDLAGLYVWHCHILEHEDNEMMRPYRVVP